MTYNYGTESAVLGTVFAILGIVFIFAAIVGIICIIGLWKMFKKAGEEGWKAIIPVYNMYTLATITGVSPWWILVVSIVSIISGAVPAISFLGTIVSLYFSILICVSTAKSFGKDEAFAVGLFFLSPIFYMILGVGSAEYVGKKPMNDPVMNFVNKEILHKETTEETSTKKEAPKAEKVCKNCGAKISEGSSFCTSCGTKAE